MKKQAAHSENQLSFDFGDDPLFQTAEVAACSQVQPVTGTGAMRFTLIRGGLGGSAPVKTLEPDSAEITKLVRSTAQAIGW